MRLEDLTIALRPRLPWEAADLGCTLVRRDYGRLLLLWLITVVPLWIILGLLLWDRPLWFGFVAWWLKPLYDRVPLFHLSRAAFGARPTLRETLRAWPRLWSRFLLSALLFRRLSFIRSFALPVWMLEGQRGGAVRKRVNMLATDGGGSGTSLTAIFVHLELAVWLGLSALISSIGPASGLPDLKEMLLNPDAFMEVSAAEMWFNNALYLAAITMIEPFYVGAGFGLYLNSRIKIEGWDIELTFRRLAARLRPVVTALLAVGLLLPVLGFSQDTPPPKKSEPPPALQEILARPEFKEHTRSQQVWVSDETGTADGREDSGGSWMAMFTNGRWIEAVFYLLLFGAAAFLLALAVRWLIKNKHLFGISLAGPKKPDIEGPRVVMGLDIAQESLPDDIVSAARAAWQAGRPRQALSLLYRGSLSRLVQRRLPIRASDTEDDCLMKTALLGDAPVTDFFRQLTLLWVRAAYAGQEAQAAEFEQLCSTWPFPAASPSKPGRFPATAAAALLLALLLPSLTGCGKGHFEEVTLPLGYRGQARIDPFLAAQELLQEYGHVTERKAAFTVPPDSYNGVVFVSGEGGMPEARAHQLLAWAREGGHVVYSLAGCAPYNDWGMFSGLTTFAYAGNENRADPVLQELGITMSGSADLMNVLKQKMKDLDTPGAAPKETQDKSKTKTTPKSGAQKLIQEPEQVPARLNDLTFGQDTFKVEFPTMHTLSLDRFRQRDEYISGDRDKATMISLVRGRGRVTVLTHARPLRNRYLDENDHARWLLALVGEGPHHVQFITTLEGSFWSLLWGRAWMPLTGLAVLTLFWLWRYLPRFGPLQQADLHDTRRFADHISALGQFFHRLKRPDILLAAAADAVRARALRQHPHLVHLDDEALVDLLSDRSPLPKDRIRAAFVTTGQPASHDLLRRLQDLQALKQALG